MERTRKPFQGVTNIVKFNWHFYLLAGVLVLLILAFNNYSNHRYLSHINVLCLLLSVPVLLSLLASFYIYDLSNLYTFDWLDNLNIDPKGKTLNINAGFDETSVSLSQKYPDSELHVFDFYDPKKHTEESIKRARKAYSSYKGTIQINTSNLPLSQYADNIFVIFAAHEIRNDAERIKFFKELNRVTKRSGRIVITEHLRNVPNFLAYSIGAFHFLPRSSWYKTFDGAGLKVCGEIKITPFVTTFVLEKNGTAP